MPSKLMEYFNKSPRIGMLSTADRAEKVDSGVFGSPRMTDENTVIMGFGKNRTLANLQQNPYCNIPDHGTISRLYGPEGDPGLFKDAEYSDNRSGSRHLPGRDGEDRRRTSGKNDLRHSELLGN